VTVAVDPGVLAIVGPSIDGPIFRILDVALVGGLLALLIIRAVATDEEAE
jgi:hypothetical protein